MALDFFQTYIQPYLVTLGIALVSVLFAFWLTGKRANGKVKSSLRAELRSNMKVTKAIITYADGQLSGQISVAPMPMYRTRAFDDYKKLGFMEHMHSKIAEELEDLYLSMFSVNNAGERQEELAFGPAAAYPNAHTLRLENLTYVRDTAHNIISPYQDRLKDAVL